MLGKHWGTGCLAGSCESGKSAPPASKQPFKTKGVCFEDNPDGWLQAMKNVWTAQNKEGQNSGKEKADVH